MAFAALMAAAALAFAPIGAAIAYAGGLLAWTALAVAAFRHALALPLIEPYVAGLFATVATIVSSVGSVNAAISLSHGVSATPIANSSGYVTAVEKNL